MNDINVEKLVQAIEEQEQQQVDNGSRLTLPPADINRSIVPVGVPDWLGGGEVSVDLRHGIYGMVAGLPTFGLGTLATTNELGALGAGAGMGVLAWTASSNVDRTIETPVGMAKNWGRKHMLNWTLPLTSDELLSYWEDGAPIHGIRRIFDDGTIQMWDGRLVAFIRTRGPNLEKESASVKQSRSESLAAGIRSNIQGGFCWYFTTTEEVVESIVDAYRQAANSERFADSQYELLREYLYDKMDYEQTVEPSRWRTRELLSYAVVEVSPADVESAAASALSRADRMREKVPGMEGTETGKSYQRSIDAQLRKRLNARVENMTSALTSMSGVDQSDLKKAGPTEVAMLAADYWGGAQIDMDRANSAPSSANVSVWPTIGDAIRGEGPESHRPTPVERRLERDYGSGSTVVEDMIAGIERVNAISDGQEAARELQSPDEDAAGVPAEVFDGEDAETQEAAAYAARLREHLLSDSGFEAEVSNLSPEQTAIAPTDFRMKDGYLKVGDEYVKTFWASGWAPTPNPDFLEGIRRHEKLHPDSKSRANEVKFNVCMRVNDISVPDAIEYLEHACNKLGVEVDDETDEITSASLDTQADYYRVMLYLLKTMGESLSPWRINGYVTIRAGTKQGIEEARHQLEQGYVPDEDADSKMGREDVLEDSEEVLFDALKSASPGLVLHDEAGKADLLFASGFPTSHDLYNQRSGINRYQMCLSGTVGAMLPFSEKVPQEPGGIEFGRHRATGLKMYADQFARGKAPHSLGIGDSGSSKTFSKGMRWLDWFCKEEGRTVVVADTMGEFIKHCDLLGDYGNHIPVDSSTTVNPFEIREISGKTLNEDIKPGEMTFQAAQEWLLSEIKSQGGDPDYFRPIVEQLITRMYLRADIDIDDPSTFGNGNPGMEDFLETIDYLEDHPEEATIGESNSETEDILEELRKLKRRLSGFSELGQNRHMMGESDVELEEGKFNYLDLSSVESAAGEAGTSAMLQLMLKQVYELVKTTDKELVFLIDEAHLLLRSEWCLEWISTSGVHWRHFMGAVDAVTHRPGELVSGPEDPNDYKDRFRSQVATEEFWNIDSFDTEYAREFFTDSEGNLNDEYYDYVEDGAVTGDSDKPYSTSMVRFADHEGWYTNHIRTGKFATAFHSWKPSKHGPMRPFLRYILDGGDMDRYEDLYEEGVAPFDEYLEENQGPVSTTGPVTPEQPETPTAATDGGEQQPSETDAAAVNTAEQEQEQEDDSMNWKRKLHGMDEADEQSEQNESSEADRPRDENGRFVSRGER